MIASVAACVAAACAAVCVSSSIGVPLILPDWLKGLLLILFVVSAFISVCKVFFSRD